MTKVFFSVGMTLDGFMAREGMDLEHADDPGFNDWLGQWVALQQWVENQKFFRENLGLGEEGETSRDNQLLEETFNRGRRLFEGIDRREIGVELVGAINSLLATHLRYTVTKH